MSEVNDYNQTVIDEFRANHGKVGGPFEGMPIVLLTTKGAKSGTTRVNPLVPLVDGEHLYVFASKAGAPTNPDWYHNVLATPDVAVEFGDETFAARAVPLTGAERDRVYARQVEHAPQFGEYERSTDRVIPVIELVRSA